MVAGGSGRERGTRQRVGKRACFSFAALTALLAVRMRWRQTAVLGLRNPMRDLVGIRRGQGPT